MKIKNEYAEQYSKKERIRFFIIAVIFGLSVHFILKPTFENLISKSQCYEIFGLSGEQFVVYSYFFGVPLVIFFPVSLFLFIRGIKIIKVKQIPLPDQKVFSKTKIKKGNLAVFSGYLHLTIPIIIAPFIFWGFNVAEESSESTKLNAVDYAICTANKAN